MSTDLKIEHVVQPSSSYYDIEYEMEKKRFAKFVDLRFIRTPDETILRVENYFDPDTGKYEADEIEPLINIVKDHLETTKRKKTEYKSVYHSELNERERRLKLLLNTLNNLLKMFIGFGYVPMKLRV